MTPADLIGNVDLAGPDSSADRIVEAVNRYLASWPPERIRALPNFEHRGGPSDVQKRAMFVSSLLEVTRLFEAAHFHRKKLTESGVRPEVELVELECFLHAISQVANADPTIRPLVITDQPSQSDSAGGKRS